MLIIGSEALQFYGILNRTPLDRDIMGTLSELERLKASGDYKSYFPLSATKEKLVSKSGLIVEFEIAEYSPSCKNLLEMLGVEEHFTSYATPKICLLLKESHKYLKNSPHFNKTMKDIKLLRETLGIGSVKVCDMGWSLKELLWFGEREKETYTYALPKLNQGKDTFFNDTEDFYFYDHDTIHTSVALGDRPAYLEYKPEDEDVWCSKEMFDNCEEYMKLRGVYEEALVLTLERYIIPNRMKNKYVDPYDGFKIALMKVCTSITSGWFREYAWENYNKVLQMYAGDFVSKFNRDLKNGLIKPFKEECYE